MISKTLRVIVCTTSFVYTSYVLWQLTYFLSKPIDPAKTDFTRDESPILRALWILLINTSLLSAFMLQHSVMASDFVKNFYYQLNIEDIERSVYNAISSAILHFLICEWQCTPWAYIWNYASEHNHKLWLFTNIAHIVGWGIVYSGCVMMDIADLSGLKQVYYKITGRPRPLSMKSKELQKYYMHMRHPSFIGFLIILWVYPLMSLDRLLLAVLLTLYMALLWTIEQDDYNYHSTMVARKERDLNGGGFSYKY
ncbi:hypothetical protein QAD02_006671 [Eretmocerus hayati]|uniref:Uncharacterized protein n=1 Tax=Eretmocerus hayati TaxID=131215 RepID=A0ACC2N1T1_9HYME|nr:hypothetical protein QAD02_006671 [Eretmocerus hayati]